MKLVDDWREARRWISMWCMGLSTAFLASWALIPDDLKTYLTAGVQPKWMALGVATLLVFGMVGRLVDQGKK